MDDYSKLLPYLISEFGDFDVFQKHLNQDIDYSKASFDLKGLKITSWEEVGNVKYIGGDLHLAYNPIKSLGSLQSVGGYLGLSFTSIKSLGNLESVGGPLSLFSTPNLTDLGNLKEVKDRIYYEEGTKVEELLKE